MIFHSFKLANVHFCLFRFLKGLNALVPENLLSIFDENELEVCFLMIYIHNIRVSKFKGYVMTYVGYINYYYVYLGSWG